MNAFVSTRGTDRVTFAQALFQGLAPDGGLYMPAEPAVLGPDRPPSGVDFAETARWAARRMLSGAMDAAEALDFPIPLVEVEDGTYVLELFHGPSLAFKDVGARFMARAMAALAEPGRTRTVLVATSGDTGGAVAAAFHGMDGYRVVVLFPRGGISERQRRQITTLGGNVQAVAVEGTFDDCQRLAKMAFADPELPGTCRLTSANSINIGRLVPQSFYYIHAAAALGWDERPVTFVVPSGNLGNLCAGLMAHRAGMPARGFVAAANRNRVFVDYLESGRFEPRRSVPTPSNAMDVGDPSNFERIRHLYGYDHQALRAHVHGQSVDDEQTRDRIARVHAATGYVMDPHTAVGWEAMERLRGTMPAPRVVLATAHPWKFPDVIESTLGLQVPLPPGAAPHLSGEEHVITIPASLSVLADLLLTET